ncbi:MAG TPA: thioesterase family protein [Acidimicrobiales bacterium]
MTGPTTADESAYYLPDGGRLVPTILTQGPWHPNAQHGGPVCALFAWAAERVPSLVPMQITRLTVNLWRAVPLTPLRVAHDVRREGKRLQVIDLSLFDGETEVASAQVLRVRTGDTSDPEVTQHPHRPSTAPPPLPTGGGQLFSGPAADRIGFIRSLDAQRVIGRLGEGAPSVMWVRMRQPLVAGCDTPPAARAAFGSDFASALASYLDISRWSYINPDVNLHLLREPTSEWIGIDGTTWVGERGIGHGRASMFDLDGFIGTASASQVVDRHPDSRTVPTGME